MRGLRYIGGKSKSRKIIQTESVFGPLLASPGVVWAYLASGARSSAPNMAHFGYNLKRKIAISVDANIFDRKSPQNEK